MIPCSLIRLAIQQRLESIISHAETGKKWEIFPHRRFNQKQVNAYTSIQPYTQLCVRTYSRHLDANVSLTLTCSICSYIIY
jgi:hypothetical protein